MEPGVRARLVQSTTPHTVHEIQAVVQAWNRGEQYAQVTRAVAVGRAGQGQWETGEGHYS